MKPFVLITGASSGIGVGCARLLVEQGYRVIGTVRRREDGVRIREQLGEAFLPLLLDVTDPAALEGAVRQVEILVGAAGLAALLPTRWIDRILARKMALPRRA
ncbi:SDR family NAD(P)-dependent oxidoreductase [Pseudomonas cavernicola]|uniref:SDR family NAD(P)-dependent oxidoreductase n=1 Tax=Pseudomonas cavernicola TaxID=2320866 RepID=A0A418X8Y6_9PSED|nr:SDR family NAD(P)-dependent oxidoreductase [Pseudomonas cavernicola]RJG08942.1 SDR family NAD(P)-dependent oxidoreductase [Pseudomonas cavernicola]